MTLTFWLVVVSLFVAQDSFAAYPGWLVGQQWVEATYNPSAVLRNDDKSQINLVGSFGRIDNETSPRYAMLQTSMPLKTDMVKLGIGLDGDYYKAGDFDFKQFHVEFATGLKVGTGVLTAGIAPGFYSSLTFDDESAKIRRNRFSLNAGARFENRLFNIGASVTQIATGENCLGHFGGTLIFPLSVVEIIPSVFETTDFSYSRTDLLVQMRLWHKLTAGGGWSTEKTAAVMARVDLKDFYVGYAYSFSTGKAEFKRHGHELYVGYLFKLDFGSPIRYGSKSIRYM